MTVFEDSFSEEVWRSTYKDYREDTIDGTIRRVAKAVASVEKTEELKTEWEEKFYELLSDFKATPGGRIYSNAGTEWKGTTLMNCFVSPHPKKDMDSLEGIMKMLRDQSFTLKSEGGWGSNFSYLRPRGSFIHGIGVETPGAVKYMELFDKSSDIITSGSGLDNNHHKAKGKIRKGAMMGVLNVWHPDVIEFITAKQTPGRLTKFNISVNCTDKFMNKIIKVQSLKDSKATEEEIKTEDNWDLKFPDTTHSKYKAEWQGDIEAWESKGYPVKVYRTVSATWLWNLIMESTYNRAEPGVLFLDRANHFNALNYKDTIFATNPCISGDAIIDIELNGNRETVSMRDLVSLFNDEANSIKVKSCDITNQKDEYKEVLNALMTRVSASVMKITDQDSGISLICTPDHKVYTSNRGYVQAKDLKEEDVLKIMETTK